MHFSSWTHDDEGTSITLGEKKDSEISRLRDHNHRQRVFSLPTELLAYIFELACLNLAHLPHDVHAYLPIMRRTRYAIATTCYLWREVALSSPELWRFIIILNDDDAQFFANLNESSTYTRRMESNKLAAYLCNFPGHLEWHSFQPLLLSMLGCCEMVVSTDIRADDHFQLFSTQRHWPNLRKLGISWTPPHEINAPRTIDLTNAVALESLWIECDFYSRQHTPVQVTLRWPGSSMIKKLWLTGPSIDPLCSLPLIQSCLHLEILGWVTYESMSDLGIEITDTIHLAHLRELTTMGDLAMVFMTKLDAPNLTRLRTSLWRRDYRDIFPLSDTLQFPSLRSLRMNKRDNCILDYRVTEDLGKFLRAHGDLQHLYLPWCLNDHKELLGVLGSPSLLPNLEYVTMEAVLPELTEVEGILKGRLQGQQPKKFTLYLLPCGLGRSWLEEGAARLVEKFGDSICCGDPGKSWEWKWEE